MVFTFEAWIVQPQFRAIVNTFPRAGPPGGRSRRALRSGGENRIRCAADPAGVGVVTRWIRALLVVAPAFALVMAAGPRAAPEAGLPMLTGARLSTTDERARLVIDLSAPANFRFFAVDQPARIVVEIEAGAMAFDPPPQPGAPGLVSEYHVGMVDEQLARAVMMVSGPVQVQQAFVTEPAGDQPARLIVDLIPDTTEGFAASIASVQTPETAEPATRAPPTAEPQAPATTVGRPLIVIDPGHGGIDSGARAANGLLEKTITLRFALDLQRALAATGKFDVALTRDSDRFVSLSQRVALARGNHADLMVSLHADSFEQPGVRGASIYTRDEGATDALDKVLAEQENKVDLVAGFSPPQADGAVVDILVDLMRREARRRAYLVAAAIIDELERSVTMRRFPLRRADFLVLQAPEVPSILVELGFLSNPDDISNLAAEEWRDRVAGALARGIADYFERER